MNSIKKNFEKKNKEKTIINNYDYRSKTIKSRKKLIIYTRAFIQIYNQCNYKLVYKIYEIVKLEKYLISRTEIFLNLGTYQFYKIFLILQIFYILLRNNKSKIFYINNYIDQN